MEINDAMCTVRTFLQQSTFLQRAGDRFGRLLRQLELDRAGAEQALGGVDGQIEQGIRLLVGIGWQRAHDFVLRDGLSGALNWHGWVSVMCVEEGYDNRCYCELFYTLYNVVEIV